MKHRDSFIVAMSLIVSIETISLRGFAQAVNPNVLATAQTLNNEAQEAMEKKDYASACPKFEEVVRLIPEGVGAKLSLAECYEGAGKLASAWIMYALVDEVATKPTQAQLKKMAHGRAETLKSQFSKLTIIVPESVRGVAGFEVTRDGLSVGSAQWGVPLPIDKGAHMIVAIADRRQRWEKKIEIGSDGITETITIDNMPDLVPESPAPPPSARPPTPLTEMTDGGLAPKDLPVRTLEVQKISGLALGGAGIAGIGVGAAFGIVAILKKSESGNHCEEGTNLCDQVGMLIREDGRSAGTVSTAMFITGGVALGAGVALYLTSPRSRNGAGAKVAVGLQGLSLSGSW